MAFKSPLRGVQVWRRRQNLMLGGAQTYAQKVLGYSPIAYWPLYEASGTTVVSLVSSPTMDATYNSDVSTWPPGTGIGDGNTAPFFDGTNDLVDLPEGALDSVLDGNEGTALLWGRVAAGVWTDGVQRAALWVRNAAVDFLYLSTLNAPTNTWRWFRRGAAVSDSLSQGGHSETGWWCAAFTWSTTDDAMRYYWNGAEQFPASATLGAWNNGSALNDDYTLVGSGRKSTLANMWHGYLAHVQLYNSALSPTAIADLSTV